MRPRHPAFSAAMLPRPQIPGRWREQEKIFFLETDYSQKILIIWSKDARFTVLKVTLPGILNGFWLLFLIRDLPQTAQQRSYGQSLHKYRKRHHAESNGQNFLSIGQRIGNSQCQSQSQCAAQAAPKQYVLELNINFQR